MTAIAVLLTFASGATDVISFTRLGNVFASVMTGNMVIFGLSLARGSVSLAAHTATAFAGYVLGVATGTRIAWFHARRTPGAVGASPWPPHTTMSFLFEFLLMAGVAAGWEVSAGRPAGATQFVILALAACASGIQSAAVTDMGLQDVSTTFLTGTLTGLVGALADPARPRPGLRRPGVLFGLVSGALLAGVLVAYAPEAALVPPLAALIVVIVAGSGNVQVPSVRVPRPRRPR